MNRCIEHMILHWRVRGASDHDGDILDQVFDPTTGWQENLYRAMHRNVLIGAAYSRAYCEPLFSAVENGNWSMAQELVKNRRPPYEGMERSISDEVMEYLRKSPVYNYDADDSSKRRIWRNHEYEMVFGPLATWPVEDGKARAREKGFDEHSTEREMAHLLAAYMQLSSKVVTDDPSRVLGRKSLAG